MAEEQVFLSQQPYEGRARCATCLACHSANVPARGCCNEKAVKVNFTVIFIGTDRRSVQEAPDWSGSE